MTSPTFIYSVIATLPDDATLETYINWLIDGHVQAVIDGGAASAQVNRLEPNDRGERRVESRYAFPDRAAFETYERDTAPALREDGIQRFGSIEGVSFERATGHTIRRWP